MANNELSTILDEFEQNYQETHKLFLSDGGGISDAEQAHLDLIKTMIEGLRKAEQEESASDKSASSTSKAAKSGQGGSGSAVGLPPLGKITYRVSRDGVIYKVVIEGHASPRWRFPGRLTPAQRNLELSQKRALAVEDALRSLFAENSVDFGFECTADDHGSSIDTSWFGSAETLEEAAGDLDANHEELRRVDISIEVEWVEETTGGMSQEVIQPNATQDWAIKVDAVLTGGLGAAGSYGMATVKNRLTGQTAKGKWFGKGGGGGPELPIPAASPNPSWTNFRTSSPITFDALDGTPVRLTHLDIGIGIVGYSKAEFTFTDYMDKSVSVGGFVLNQWGAGGSVTAGNWTFDGPVPKAPKTVEEVEFLTDVTVGESRGHRVRFQTGSADISSEMSGLRKFVELLLR